MEPVLTSFSCGIQAYWGGLAIALILGSIFPSFAYMANTLPISAAISTQQLIGFVIYIVIFIPLLFIHPSKLQPLLVISLFGISFTFIGLFAYAVGANGGTVSLIAPTIVVSSE